MEFTPWKLEVHWKHRSLQIDPERFLFVWISATEKYTSNLYSIIVPEVFPLGFDTN